MGIAAVIFRIISTSAITCLVATLLAACGATLPPVVESLDEQTAVTVTRPRTPLILSPNAMYSGSAARDYVQIAPIEINRMGTLNYYLWLGIWDLEFISSEAERPPGFDNIEIVVDGDSFSLDRLSWNHEEIGTSSRMYKKIFREDVDAYYVVSLEQLNRINDASEVRLRSSGTTRKEYVPWYNQEKAAVELDAFVRTVAR